MSRPARGDRARARIGRRALMALSAALVGCGLLFAASGASAGRQRGAMLFTTAFTPGQGLGPLFNNTSCVACHNTPTPGGSGPNGLATVIRVGKLDAAGFDGLSGHGGPVSRAHAVSELGGSCDLSAGVPTGRVGRFGWKADTTSVRQFVGEAFRNELGLTNPIAPFDLVDTCTSAQLDIDESVVDSVTTFIDDLPAPAARPGDPTVFEQVGCGACHVAQLDKVPLYSDLLVHDMGRALDDGVVQGQARGSDWRTTPLWGLSQRSRYLHDSRARTVEAAILAHSGEADSAVTRFRALSDDDRAALLGFLATL